MSGCVPHPFKAHQRLLANSCASWRSEASDVPASTFHHPSGSPRCSLLDPSKAASPLRRHMLSSEPWHSNIHHLPRDTESHPFQTHQHPPASLYPFPALSQSTDSLTHHIHYSFCLAPVSLLEDKLHQGRNVHHFALCPAPGLAHTEARGAHAQ